MPQRYNNNLLYGGLIDFAEPALLEPCSEDVVGSTRRARVEFLDALPVNKTFAFELFEGVRGERKLVRKVLTLRMVKKPSLNCSECGSKGHMHAVSHDDANTVTVWCAVCERVETRIVSFFPLPTASALRELGLNDRVHEVRGDPTDGGNI